MNLSIIDHMVHFTLADLGESPPPPPPPYLEFKHIAGGREAGKASKKDAILFPHPPPPASSQPQVYFHLTHPLQSSFLLSSRGSYCLIA